MLPEPNETDVRGTIEFEQNACEPGYDGHMKRLRAVGNLTPSFGGTVNRNNPACAYLDSQSPPLLHVATILSPVSQQL